MIVGVAETGFRESNDGVRSREDLSILERKISELQLRIEGTHLEKLTEQLHRELDARALSFRPRCYLSDEWGCPEGVPVIGIPFYLANPMLARIEEEREGDVEEDPQIMMYLRHEAGHAFNYAYRLYETEEWHAIFGPYTRPYIEEYRPAPFSKKYVRHIPGWYAQKHPDEDFAETFAVWLMPGSNWEHVYKDWPALEKLRYVDRVMRSLPPVKLADTQDLSELIPVEQMTYTVREHYARQTPPPPVSEQVGAWLDGDLRDLFGASEDPGQPAGRWILQRRREMTRDVAYWTGAQNKIIGALVDHLADRATVLGLVVSLGKDEQMLTHFSIMLTTLVVNHLYRDRFVDL
jgi:hypothetical protein